MQQLGLMKAVDDSNVALKRSPMRIPGNCAELRELIPNATKRMCIVGSNVGSGSTTQTRIESFTVWLEAAAADRACHTLPAPRRYSTAPVQWTRSTTNPTATPPTPVGGRSLRAGLSYCVPSLGKASLGPAGLLSLSLVRRVRFPAQLFPSHRASRTGTARSDPIITRRPWITVTSVVALRLTVQAPDCGTSVSRLRCFLQPAG